MLEIEYFVNHRLQVDTLDQAVHVFKPTRRRFPDEFGTSNQPIFYSLRTRADQNSAHIDFLTKNEHREAAHIPSLYWVEHRSDLAFAKSLSDNRHLLFHRQPQ